MVYAWETPPPEVTDPVFQLVSWVLWAVALAEMVWLVSTGVAAYSAHKNGEEFTMLIGIKLLGIGLTASAAAISAALIV